MTERIKAHLDSLLQNAPKTRRVEEMRQELLAGCLDKYADLTAAGASPEDAYREVIDGIGDVYELLGHIERVNVFDPKAAEEKRKKRALFTITGISLFLLGMISAIIADTLWYASSLSGILILIFASAGVLVLIYGRMTNSAKYEKMDDTLVENIKVQMTEGKKGNKLMGLASGSLWCLILVAYFFVSFLSGNWWHLTWLIFILGAALQCCLAAAFSPSSRRKSIAGAFWCAVVIAYFLISFETMAWHLTWIIFIMAAAVQLATGFFLAWRDEK